LEIVALNVYQENLGRISQYAYDGRRLQSKVSISQTVVGLFQEEFSSSSLIGRGIPLIKRALQVKLPTLGGHAA
jgi:hypothetical protein